MTLPQGWLEVPFEDVVYFQEGPGLRKFQYRDTGTPFLNIRTFHRGNVDKTKCGYLDPGEVLQKYSHFLVDAGDILYASSGSLGKMAIARSEDLPLVLNTSIIRFRPHNRKIIESRYLYWYLRSDHFTGQTLAVAAGSAQLNFGPTHVRQFKFVFPPLAEQRRIIAKLDALTARLARARAELDRVPVLAESLRRKLYHDAFHYKGKQRRLEEITPPNAPIIYGILQPGPHIEGGIPYVRPTEIKNGVIQLSDLRRTTSSIAAQYRRATIQAGDLILTIVGTIGKVAEVPLELEGGNITQSSCRIRVDEEVADRNYVRHWLQSPQAWAQYEAGRLGTAVPRLNLRDIRSFNIALPPIDEQVSIASSLDAAFARADRLEAEAARARALIDRLESAILAKAFRGELVAQDPNDEPASVLLDRIRAERAAAPKAKRGRRATADA